MHLYFIINSTPVSKKYVYIFLYTINNNHYSTHFYFNCVFSLMNHQYLFILLFIIYYLFILFILQ